MSTSKQRYLELATEMACRPPRSGLPSFPHAVAHVRIVDVARAAGVTRSAVYRHWGTQEEFWSDLAAHLAAGDEPAWLRTLLRSGDEMVCDRTGEASRRALNRIQEEYVADRGALVRASLVAYPDVGPALDTVAASERRCLSHVAHLADRLRAARGLRFADGLGSTDVAAALACLGEGFSLAARVLPEPLVAGPVATGASGDRPWGPLAFGARSLFRGLTRLDGTPGSAPGAPPGAASSVPAVPPRPAGDRPGATATVGGKRREYLRLAARLAMTAAPAPADDDPVPALGHVTLAGLARETGADRRRLYELWPSQTDFRLDLLTHLMARASRELGDVLVRSTDGRRPAGGADPILPVGDRLFGWLRDSDWLATVFAFAPLVDQRAVHERGRDAAESLLAAFGGGLRAVLAAAGLELRPGVTIDQLALLLLSLVAGTVRTLRTNPALWRTDVRLGGGTHTLFGVALAAVVRETTAPR